ncbi:MAG: 5'-nucleotidase C-terminal domain-containing protein, partial [Acidobacteria bacterium]|nr:5'-nucleotidase C-terminal domain-containing protein [Acidobacteriota bacterium]
VVTAIAFNGYYVQDPVGDGDDATSDGIFVFQFGGIPNIGDLVEMTDTVTEFVPGGCGTGNLSTTQMSFPTLINMGPATLPTPVIIGSGGRVAPAVDVISPGELPVELQPSFCTSLSSPGVFNPANDGIDFYESLEGMLVTVEAPVAVSATRTFSAFSSELFTLTNNGANIAPADARTARGGINLQPHPDNIGDQNPERVQIQFDPTLSGGASVPAITVGDTLGDVTGVVGYSFGNFEVNATQQVTFTSGGLGLETTSLVPEKKKVAVASYNVLNLAAVSEDDAQRATLAGHITDNLGGPDVIALQEIQDNNGTTNDGTTDATETLQMLVEAISAAGGPDYDFFDVAPVDGTSGGVPGGNIRNAFLYNADRVKLVDFVSLTPTVLTDLGVDDPNAFSGTRNPLMATFKFRGKEFTVVNNHLTSRFGSTPVFGGPQPFVQAGEAEREAQTGALNEVVDALLAGAHGNSVHASSAGRIMVVGDLNTMEFTNDITDILPGTGGDRVLNNLIDTLTDDNVYTFNFEGNSQVLDHMLVTDNLAGSAQFDIVHLNVDFPRVSSSAVGSDHEALVGLFDLNAGTAGEGAGEAIDIQFLTLSDWHGQLDPLFVFGQGTFGGAAELAAYWDADRADNPNTITLTAGDAYGAAPPLSSFFDEEPTVRVMRMMGFDVDTFGNHNFDDGIAGLQNLIDIAGDSPGHELGRPFQYVSANLDNRDDNLSGVEDFVILNRSGVKVAVIGITNPEAPTLVFPGSFGTIVPTDPVAAANAARQAAEDAGAGLFVAITHLGVTGFDGGGNAEGPLIDFANGVNGFDLILGDHTNFEFSKEINGALVVENRSRGRTYARISITANRNGGVFAKSVEFVEPVSSAVTPDPEIVAFLDPLRAQLSVLLSGVIGQSTVVIPRDDECGQSSGRHCESLIGDVVADAMRDRYGTQFAIVNSGGLRADLTCPDPDVTGDFCPAPDGGNLEITDGTVLTVLPFGNSVVTLTVSGPELKAHLERAVSAAGSGSGRFAQVSGLCFTYDIEAAVGSRVTSVVFQAGDGTCTGGPVDLTASASYTLAETDFTASGGDGYPIDISTAVTRELLDQVTAAYIAANTPISPEIQGRITCTDSVGPNDCPVPVP